MSEEFSAYTKKKKENHIKRNIFIAIMALVILGAGFYFVSTKFLVVKEVLVQGTDLYPKEEILSAIAIEEGKPILFLSKKEISRSIEENFPYLVNAAVTYDLPHTVNVTFQEEFGILAVKLGSELYSVDRKLNVLAKENADSEISRIELVTDDISRCIVGEKLTFFESERASELKKLLVALEEAEMIDYVSMLSIADKFNMKIKYLDRFELSIGENSDLKQKFAMVKEVVKDLGEEETGKIDISDPNTAYVKLSGQI